jgi:hypothetical protein
MAAVIAEAAGTPNSTSVMTKTTPVMATATNPMPATMSLFEVNSIRLLSPLRNRRR